MGIESVKETEELEKEGEKVIVEIGCGKTPFPLFGKRKLKENETYIGIEPDVESAENAKNVLNDHREITGAEKFEIFKRLGEETGLLKNSVDEIVITNVAGYRGIALKFNGIAKEAKRILKDGGLVYIVETNTPYNKPEDLVKLFENNGFVLQYFIKSQQGESFKKEIEKYMLKSMIALDPYLMKFIKVVK